ncbi:MAG: class I SAM-dependent methyltransferase [Pseudomonadota bacterium]
MPSSPPSEQSAVTVGAVGERSLATERWRSAIEYALYLEHLVEYDWVKSFCPNQRVIELGCGFGYGTRRVAEVADQVVAYDVDDELLSQLQPFATDNLTFAMYDGDRLPLADDAVDVAFSLHVVEHVDDPKAFLEEQRRVTRPGGAVLVGTPNGAERLLPGQRPWNPYHLREYRPAEFVSLMQSVFPTFEVFGVFAAESIQRLQDAKMRRRRTQALKWVSQSMPGPMWRGSLKTMGRLRAQFRGEADQGRPADAYPFSANDYEIRPELDGSVGLLAVGKPEAASS